MSLHTKQMERLTPRDQALKAIAYALHQIHDRPEVGWYCGIGTQTFALLTEAYATLTDSDLEDVAESFACPNAKDPRKAVTEEAIAKAIEQLQDEYEPTIGDVREAIAELPISDRLELLEDVRADYCFRCGGRAPVKPCYCRPFAGRQFQMEVSR